MSATTTTYGSYLQIDQLLALQKENDAPDHLLFVVMHQSHELWFKLLLHELERCIVQIDADELATARATIHRAALIVRTLTGQWEVLDTMTPAGYLAFRDVLESGSGFQSVQFREIEFVSGEGETSLVEAGWLSAAERDRLRNRANGPTIREGFFRALARRKVTLIDAVAGTVDPDLTYLAEALTDYDEAFAHWRSRHTLAVERQIGTKSGTGGSSGVEYLRSTTTKRFFPELWEARSQLPED